MPASQQSALGFCPLGGLFPASLPWASTHQDQLGFKKCKKKFQRSSEGLLTHSAPASPPISFLGLFLPINPHPCTYAPGLCPLLRNSPAHVAERVVGHPRPQLRPSHPAWLRKTDHLGPEGSHPSPPHHSSPPTDLLPLLLSVACS